MQSDWRKTVLSVLFSAFESPYSFYVLGAGASAGIVPMTVELRHRIINRYFSHGSYPAEPLEIDDIYRRVIGEPDSQDITLFSALLRNLYPSAVHAMVIKELTPSRTIKDVHAYEIFLLLKKPSTIFNMNIDGIAARYRIGHYLLEPHGRVPTNLVLSPFWDELIDALLDFGFDAPKIPDLLLPKPEPCHITSKAAYSKAILLFRYGKYLVFIGYSFGQFQESIDDFETFEFFRDLLRTFPKNVLVISPNPEFVGNSIEEAVGNTRVHLLPVHWNYLCRAIKEVSFEYKWPTFRKLCCLMGPILYRHDQLVDEVP